MQILTSRASHTIVIGIFVCTGCTGTLANGSEVDASIMTGLDSSSSADATASRNDSTASTADVTTPNQDAAERIDVPRQTVDAARSSDVFTAIDSAIIPDTAIIPDAASIDVALLRDINAVDSAQPQPDAASARDAAPANDVRPPPTCIGPPTGGFHVSVTGSASGDGTSTRPWDLATALAQPSSVTAGTQIWLHGGRYAGSFTSTLSGSDGNPITVASYPGEWAIVDGVEDPTSPTFTVNGSDTTYRDFEIMNSYPVRTSSSSGSSPSDRRGAGLEVFGPRTRFINLSIHDAGGNAVWRPAIDAEVYGCLIYYNGWNAPDRGHGHALYVQNMTGVKRITDNIWFRQFSYGLHAYTEGGNIDNIHAQGNIAFNSGEITGASSFTTNFLIGGLRSAIAPTLSNNYSYFPTGFGQERLGYSAGCTNATVQNNYFVARTALEIESCALTTFSGNTFVGEVQGAPTPDTMNTYLSSRPTSGTRVFVRRNEYEAGRAHIAVYNWERLASVSADVSEVLAVGDAWQLFDAQDMPAGPIASGTYAGGTITIPMDHTGVAAPVGAISPVPPHTDREFGAFILRRVCP